MGQVAIKSHVSMALLQLRRGVTVCAAAVMLCALAQAMIFGAVHFTEVRFEPRAAASSGGETPAKESTVRVYEASPDEATRPMPVAAARPLSQWDRVLRASNMVVVTAGTFGSVLLALMVALGVVIGANVAGVQRAVSAAMWAMLVAVGALPWSDFLASVPWPGVFGSYASMTAMSAAVDAGATTTAHMAGVYLAMPVMAFLLAGLVMARFRAGVADGVAMAQASAIEQQLDQEMASIRERGVATTNVMRTVSALNQVVSESLGGKGGMSANPSIQPPPAGPNMSEDDAINHVRGIKKIDRGEPMRRLI